MDRTIRDRRHLCASGLSQDAWGNWIARSLLKVYRSAKAVPFDDTSRLVLFSDCHRGTRGPSDLFAPNEPLFLAALSYYDQHGYTYVEVGDGDELWQNVRLMDVVRAHHATFDLLGRFHDQGRLHLVQGNHDVGGRRWRLQDKAGMPAAGALTLHHRRTNQQILVTHGHQVDILSSWFSPVSRALVRHVWRYVSQWQGAIRVHQRSREGRTRDIEERLMAWAGIWQQPLICGHTHRAAIAGYGEAPYFNTGSWTRPGIATALEIQGGEITLVRWTAHPVTHHVRREGISRPRKLALFAGGTSVDVPAMRAGTVPLGCA